MSIKRHYFFLVVIIILAAVLRFVWLDKIPNGISADEFDYLFTARSIVLNGSDIGGEWSPSSLLWFKYPLSETPKAELSYFLHLPSIAIAKFSLFTARAPFVLLNVLTVLVLYLVTKKLLGRGIALYTAFISAINPWGIFIGRTAYEMPLAVFFYLLGLYLLLVLRGWRILVVIPVFTLAFYSYIGTKVVLLPFVIITAYFAYRYLNKRKYLKQYLVVIATTLLLTLLYLVSVATTTEASRVTEILSPAHQDIADTVDLTRKGSINTWFTNIFVNKLTVFIQVVVIKFSRVFSTENLFISGDKFFGIYKHGLFYYIDFAFLLLGSLMLYYRQKKKYMLLLALIVLGTVPQVIHQGIADNMVAHIVLIFPFMTIIIASGIWYLLSWIRRYRYLHHISLFLVFIVYALSLINFLNLYLYYYSVQPGNFELDKRVLSRYISLAEQKDMPVQFLGNDPFGNYKKYLLYSNSYNIENVEEIEEKFKAGIYEQGDVKFDLCLSDQDFDESVGITIMGRDCLVGGSERLSIARLIDNSEIYKIYNDKVCSGFDLSQRVQIAQLGDYAIESLSPEEFCKIYILNL